MLIPASASVLEVGCGGGDLLLRLHAKSKSGVDLSPAQIERAKERVPRCEFYVQAGEELSLPGRTFDHVILSETLNLAVDVQLILQRLKLVSSPQTRLIVNVYNALWRPLVSLATALGLRMRHPESNWLSRDTLTGLLSLAGWELIRCESRILFPVKLLGLESLLNGFVAPFLSPLCLSLFVVARPIPDRRPNEKSVSVVIPARNEAGNIEDAVTRTPTMGTWTELIFVEGNSTDNTWETIQQVKAKHPTRPIKILQQSGKGKGDAVRAGFAVAEGEILMILDADLTVPPEELPKFYDAVVSGVCEFANGSRLVYPMDEKAMQFLNLCANKTFGILFSWLLGQPIRDTLCGTKVLTKENYQRIAENRSYFGDFDPFGDFDLLFGASKLNLKILDLPIRYKERVYGQTNIQRWHHGWLLLEMLVFAARKLKFVE
ncbi:MAG: glycosyltransferase [Verrucomicrobia bacterium]|nr:glycosyltransferase [Verrucomicrobiota bacterium]MBV8481255.1 glycosyltransferase [Verrucomicrobiota bacterium]